MEQQDNLSNGQALGIAGLILGIIAFPVAFIPCIGIFALIPGVLGIILSIIAYSQANRVDAAKGLIIAALVISIIVTCVASIWVLFLSTAANEGNRYIHKFEKFSKEFEEGFEDEFDESFDTTLEDILDELEEVKVEYDELTEEEKEKAEKIGRAAGKAFREFTEEVKEITKESDSIED